jgi:hypothetical protein
MDVNEVLDVGEILCLEDFVSAGEEVNFGTHNVGEERFEELEQNVL